MNTGKLLTKKQNVDGETKLTNEKVNLKGQRLEVIQ